jgi:phytoene dehydrogenase-like protein
MQIEQYPARFDALGVRPQSGQYWDEIKESYAEELLARMSPFFHNLSSDLIIAKHVDTPLDMQRTSPSFQRGDLHGIAGYQHQFGAHRPTPELGRNTVPGVERQPYACSMTSR